LEPAVVEESYCDPFKVVARPKFKDGESIQCPNCKAASVYQSFDLIYSGDRSGGPEIS
jgi:hypothetical protein